MIELDESNSTNNNTVVELDKHINDSSSVQKDPIIELDQTNIEFCDKEESEVDDWYDGWTPEGNLEDDECGEINKNEEGNLEDDECCEINKNEEQFLHEPHSIEVNQSDSKDKLHAVSTLNTDDKRGANFAPSGSFILDENDGISNQVTIGNVVGSNDENAIKRVTNFDKLPPKRMIISKDILFTKNVKNDTQKDKIDYDSDNYIIPLSKLWPNEIELLRPSLLMKNLKQGQNKQTSRRHSESAERELLKIWNSIENTYKPWASESSLKSYNKFCSIRVSGGYNEFYSKDNGEESLSSVKFLHNLNKTTNDESKHNRYHYNNKMMNLSKKLGNQQLWFVVSKRKSEVYSLVHEQFNALGMRELPDDTPYSSRMAWNILWCFQEPRLAFDQLLPWQRVHRFVGARCLTRKDLLCKTLARYWKMGGVLSTFSIQPPTFILPTEYNAFTKAFFERKDQLIHSQHLYVFFCMIFFSYESLYLTKNILKYFSKIHVVQQYIDEPLLIDGYKFDLRLYVLVTSFQPLEAFIYTEGFARMSTEPINRDYLKDLRMHLTNSSVQQKPEIRTKESKNTESFYQNRGSKLSYSFLLQRLEKLNIDTQKLQKNIHILILKSLVCADDLIKHQPNCFEVYGYDIIIDSSLRPWLLEVNASPSFGIENDLDKRIKSALIKDTIGLLAPMPFNRNLLYKWAIRRKGQRKSRRASEAAIGMNLARDIVDVLHGEIPRPFGEMPKAGMCYHRLCPGTDEWNTVVTMKNKGKL
eukprot:GSMAST32.ASY1.ANO1.435.1 assembled CDS